MIGDHAPAATPKKKNYIKSLPLLVLGEGANDEETIKLGTVDVPG